MVYQPADFDSRAAQWDHLPRRVALANAVATAIIETVPLSPAMKVLDYGCGTGLVTIQVAPLVGTLYGYDSSNGMLEQFAQKLADEGLKNVVLRMIDLDAPLELPTGLDLVISSMTTHHVPDVATLLNTCAASLNSGGVLAIADLESEDGSFHDDATGIAHFGFAVEEMEGYFNQAGLTDVKTVRVMTMVKEREGHACEYYINLTTGQLP